MHYLDNSATTAVLPEAVEVMTKLMLTDFGNPSSQHSMGIKAAKELKNYREIVAKAMGANADEITFTSGGTEAINTAIFGAAHKNRHIGKHIITTEFEHSAVKNACKRLEEEGFAVTYLKPDETGHISAEDFENALRQDTVLVSIMLVNNEVGTLQPVEKIGAILKAKAPRAIFHIDAVQGFFRTALTPRKWNCQLMSVSGHKIGAPKGIGALYISRDIKIRPYIVGGGQEKGMRSGTEPMPSIAGFAVACEIRQKNMADDLKHVSELAEYLKSQLEKRIPWAKQNGQPDVPHVLNVSLEGCKSEVMLRILESREVYVSAGSACAKGKESAVLKAMGFDNKRIDSAIRISFAPFNTKEDIDALLDGFEQGIKMLKR